MSIKKKISIHNAIIELIDSTSPEYTSLLPTLMKWSIWADQKIASAYAYEEEIIVRDVIDRRAELPADCVYVKAIVVGDQSALDINAFYNNYYTYYQEATIPYFGESVIFNWSTTDVIYRPIPLHWKVLDNEIYFETSFEDQKITLLILRYKRDKNGFPLVNENHIEAISAYLKWRLADRERYNQFKTLKLSGASLRFVEDLKQEWARQCRNARATDNDDTTEHTRIMSDIIRHPFSGDGLLNIQ